MKMKCWVLLGLLFSLCEQTISSNFSVEYNNRLKILVDTQSQTRMESLIQPYYSTVFFADPVKIELIITGLVPDERWENVAPSDEIQPIVTSHFEETPSLSVEDIIYLREINWRGLARLIFQELKSYFEKISGEEPDCYYVAVTAYHHELTLCTDTGTDKILISQLSEAKNPSVRKPKRLVCTSPDEQEIPENRPEANTDSHQGGFWHSHTGHSLDSFLTVPEGEAAREDKLPEGFESSSAISENTQMLVDYLVEAAQAGNLILVEELVYENGAELLFGLHSDWGESALHITVKTGQKSVAELIQSLSTESTYSKLLRLPNLQNQTPRQLLQNTEYSASNLQSQNIDSQTTGRHISYSHTEDLQKPATPPVTGIGITSTFSKILGYVRKKVGSSNDDGLSDIPNQSSSYTPHPFVEEAMAVKPEDELIIGYFRQYNLDLKQYRNPAVQEESSGREECAVHPGFCHADVALPCCAAFICQPAAIALARMMISGYMRNHDDHIDCPVCREQLNLVKALENLKAKTEERIMVESSKPADSQLRAILGLGRATPESILLTSYRKTKAFSDDILDILYDHIEVKRRFNQKAVFLENTECGICMEATNCIQLSRDPKCKHRFCMECLKEYLRCSANDLNALSTGLLICPGTNCSEQIPDYIVQALAGKETLKRLHASLLKLAANKNKSLFACLNPSCDSVMDIEEACSSKVACNSCNQTSCSQCLVTPFHEGWSCQMYKTALTSQGAQAMFDAEKKRNPQNFKNCPICNTDIYKDKGCNLMHCSNCQEKFCWECIQVISRENYKHFQKGKCQLWESSGSARRIDYVIGGADAIRPRVEQPYCQRCQSENMLEQWLCGHYFCEECQRHMMNEAATNNLDLNELCFTCFNQGSAAKGKRPSPSERGPDELLFAATGGRLESDSTTHAPLEMSMCWICGKSFESVEENDVCEVCLSSLDD